MFWKKRKPDKLPKYLFEAGADNGLIAAYRAYFTLDGEELKLIKEKEFYSLLRENKYKSFTPYHCSVDVTTNDGDIRTWKYRQDYGEKYDVEKLFPLIEELDVERTEYFFIEITEFDGYQLAAVHNTAEDGHGLALGRREGVFKDGKRMAISPKIRVGSYRMFYKLEED